MKAIVCDKCGKVMLLEDERPYLVSPAGVYRLIGERDCHSLDLCEDCACELIEAVRRTKDGESNDES